MNNIYLSVKEHKFLEIYFRNGYNAANAYRQLVPSVTDSSAKELGSRMLNKIKKKNCWNDILTSAGLDDMKLAGDLAKLLSATKKEFYQGNEIAVVEDNAIRIKAVELLAELLGKKKSEISLITDLPQVVIQTKEDPNG